MLPIVTPGSAWGSDILRDGTYDAYSISWGVGGGITGTVSVAGRAAPTEPAHTPPGEWTDASYAWARGGEVTTTINAANGTATLLDEVMPELMPDTSDIPGVRHTPACPFPFDQLLCTTGNLDEECAAKLGGLLDAVLPTRLEVANAAADVVGVALAIYHGPGLHGLTSKVPADYLTEGKTAAEVISDMLLRTSPRVWYAPGVMFIDGRAFPSGTLAAPGSPLTGAGDLWVDAAVDSGSVERTDDASATQVPPEPLLADFLAECAENAVDECEGRTFETMSDGVLEWTERSGEGLTYVESDYRIVKTAGRIVSETKVTRANRMRFGNADDIAFTGGWITLPSVVAIPTLMIVEWMEKTNTYLACCPEALAKSVELTWAPRFPREDAEVDPGGAVLTGIKEVTQRWHAEGWLRSRVESEAVQAGWTFDFSAPTGVNGAGSSFSITPTYKIRSRSESFIPIGNGIWRVDTRLNDVVPLAIRASTAYDAEIVGLQDTATVDSYTVMTDAGPPSVSCGEVDPCDPEASCSSRATKRFNEAHAAWTEEMAILAAQQVNNPPSKLVQTLAVNRAVGATVGAVINTSRGSAIVARASWSGSGPRGTPSDTVSVEAWSEVLA